MGIDRIKLKKSMDKESDSVSSYNGYYVNLILKT